MKVTVLILALLFASPIMGQKRVRKPQPAPPLVIEYDPDKSPRPRPITDPAELSRLLASHPYEVVDLGHGSTYTPGGTGMTRLRVVGQN